MQTNFGKIKARCLSYLQKLTFVVEHNYSHIYAGRNDCMPVDVFETLLAAYNNSNSQTLKAKVEELFMHARKSAMLGKKKYKAEIKLGRFSMLPLPSLAASDEEPARATPARLE